MKKCYLKIRGRQRQAVSGLEYRLFYIINQAEHRLLPSSNPGFGKGCLHRRGRIA